MIEQWYAKHKVTGEIFHNRGRYCFSEKGLLQSLRNEQKWNEWYTKHPMGRLIGKPFLLSDYEMKRIELT